MVNLLKSKWKHKDNIIRFKKPIVKLMWQLKDLIHYECYKQQMYAKQSYLYNSLMKTFIFIFTSDTQSISFDTISVLNAKSNKYDWLA